jgi:hypothetical protein
MSQTSQQKHVGSLPIFLFAQLCGQNDNSYLLDPDFHNESGLCTNSSSVCLDLIRNADS